MGLGGRHLSNACCSDSIAGLLLLWESRPRHAKFFRSKTEAGILVLNEALFLCIDDIGDDFRMGHGSIESNDDLLFLSAGSDGDSFRVGG